MNVSPFIVGLTVVSLGTSLPELLVTVTATLSGHPDVAVGNVIGSNISNIALILGFTALVRPVLVHSSLLRREYPVLVAVSAAVWLLCTNGTLGRLEGLALTAGLGAFLAWMVGAARRGKIDSALAEVAEELQQPRMTTLRSSLYLVLGLGLVVAGSRMLIWGGVNLAEAFGIDELVIGLTLVALGTSLPELATTVAGTLKGEDDIAVGNVVGSNIFNTLGILGIPAMLKPLPVSNFALERDFPVMLIATAALWPICRPWTRPQGRVNRYEGGALFICYWSYIVFLFLPAFG
jgi:cation:H+ antiporter